MELVLIYLFPGLANSTICFICTHETIKPPASRSFVSIKEKFTFAVL